MSAHNAQLACIALSLDGKLLATASKTGTLIRIHATHDGTKLQVRPELMHVSWVKEKPEPGNEETAGGFLWLSLWCLCILPWVLERMRLKHVSRRHALSSPPGHSRTSLYRLSDMSAQDK